MWPLLLLALFFASMAFLPLLPITFVVGIVLVQRSRARTRRLRVLRLAALDRERKRALILALRSLP